MNIIGNGILFTNFSNEDFTWKFAGEPFTFAARSSQTIAMGSKEHNEGLARLFTKHLVDREMDKDGLPTNHFKRPEYEKKCYVEVKPEPIVTKTASELTTNLAVEPVDEAPKKRGRPAKKEEEFVK